MRDVNDQELPKSWSSSWDGFKFNFHVGSWGGWGRVGCHYALLFFIRCIKGYFWGNYVKLL